jgi:subtilisin family serine protease
VSLPSGVSAREVGLVPVAPGIGAGRLDPGEIDAFVATFPDLVPHTTPPRRPLLDRSFEWTRALDFRNDTGVDGAGVVVGVVDTGIDIEHPDFRDANGKTRIAWLITLGEPRGVHADVEEEFGCNDSAQPCAVYSAADIDAILASGDDHPLHDAGGHGTHVASIAAGNGGPMVSDAPRFVGVAPGATLVIASATQPGSGFSDGDVLNATRFIFDRAEWMGYQRPPPHNKPLPAVVNLSIGGDFGPHDGTSDLEKGLAAMVGDDKPGRVIVVAAGNSGSIYHVEGVDDPFGVHTEVHVSPSADMRVPIFASSAKNGKGYVWVTFRPGDEVSVGFEGPGGETWVALTDPGDDRGYQGEKASAGVINNIQNGKAPISPDTNSAVVAWEGEWENGSEFAIILKGHGDAQLWVTGLGDVTASSSLGLLFMKGMKQGTITVPASHPSLLAVGCTMNRLSWAPYMGPAIKISSIGPLTTLYEDSSCYFSSAGPTPFGVPKPEISAPGGFVAAAMSAFADPRVNGNSLFNTPGCPDSDVECFVVDDFHVVTAGSSMSAPHVAGAAALLLGVNPNLTQAQITEILQAGARYPTGPVPHATQLGPGELDLDGALQALMLEEASAIEPDVAKSWYVLSSSYARPDPTWPVWGTVELRREDGAVASGLAGTKLEVRVNGGALVQPVTKVRHGLFRFAIAGERGTGGSLMTVEVLYDGKSLGMQELPIGTDNWTAASGVDAVGGYSCRAAGARIGGANSGSLSLGGAIGVFGALTGVAFARRRRARRRARSR